jgi:tetratricopeptide (TPR) repeat protein
MNLILTVVFMVSGAVGQGVISANVETRYEMYRRSALTAYLQSNYKQAENDFKDALAEARSFGSSDRRVATSLSDLALLYAKTQRLEEARELLQQSVTILRTNDPDHNLCVVLNILGQVYLAENRLKDAQQTLEVALSMTSGARGSMDALSNILTNLGVLQVKQRKYRMAEESFQRSLEIRKRMPATNCLNVAVTLNEMGTLYALQAHYSKAEETLERSLKISEELLPPDHPDLAAVLENLAVVENKLHHFESSETYFRRIVEIQTQERTMGRPEFLAVYADTLRNLNKQEEADVLTAQMKRLVNQQRFIIKANPS